MGLAAPQIGIGLRLMNFCFERRARYPEAEPVAVTTLINPWLENLTDELEVGWERCLSVPGMRGLVPRARHAAQAHRPALRLRYRRDDAPHVARSSVIDRLVLKLSIASETMRQVAVLSLSALFREWLLRRPSIYCAGDPSSVSLADHLSVGGALTLRNPTMPKLASEGNP